MISRFFRGMGYFGRGWGTAFGAAGVTRWVMLPALLTVVVSGGGTWLAYRWAVDFIHRQSAGHGSLFGLLVWLGVMLLVLASAYFLYVASCLLATAPFAGVLSERTEQSRTGHVVLPATWKQTAALSARGVGHAILGVSIYLAIAIPLFLLQWFVPLLAPLVWVASIVQAGYFFAFDGFNEPLHRRGYGFGAKWSFIGKHTAESLGFGVAVALLMMVPFLSVIVTPVAIVGGTLLFLDLDQPGSSKPPTA
ncbi:MAG: cysZ [Myxococcales bacterium]|nr:cysZ [Myxococcales bacterium]